MSADTNIETGQLAPNLAPEIDWAYDPLEQRPTTYDEAMGRVQAAHDLYENYPAPEVDLPDTPERSLRELVDERTHQYWVDRAVPGAYSTSREALMIKIDAPTPELTEWAATKAKAMNILWGERVAADILFERNPEVLPEGVTSEQAIEQVEALYPKDDVHGALMLGRVRVEIKDGKPVILSNDWGGSLKPIIETIDSHRDEWEATHKMLAHAPRLSNVLWFLSLAKPFYTRLNPNEPGGMVDVGTYAYLAATARKTRQ